MNTHAVRSYVYAFVIVDLGGHSANKVATSSQLATPSEIADFKLSTSYGHEKTTLTAPRA